MDFISKLQKMIDECDKIVFFGGAGVSTESGLKDFRSKDGLYNMKYKYPPEEILSHSFFVSHTDAFYKFYKDKLNALDILPNSCHKYLTKLEKCGKLKSIITQNIDGLHQKAGSKNVIELHGTIYENYCIKCGKSYDAGYVFNCEGIPMCDCGGVVKPKVVLYEEALDDMVVEEAIYQIKNADLLIIGGTSLTVYPASSFVRYFKGKYLVIINNDKTSYDGMADLVIHDKIGDVFEKLKI